MAALELAVVNAVIGCINSFVSLLKEHRKLSGEFAGSLYSIKNELQMIQPEIEEHEDLKLQEVAHDIVNFIHGLWTPGPCGRFVLSAAGLDPRTKDIAQIKSFIDCIKRIPESLQKSDQIGSSSSPAATITSLAESHSSYALEAHLVGISGSKREIVEELLSPGDGKLRAISIVGCVGSGKTALARAIYDDAAVTGNFQCKAWVVASEHSHARDVLDQILQQVVLQVETKDRPNPKSGGESTYQALQRFLQEKRYLVFIDDVRPQELQWKDIQDAFPINDRGNRIILTTCSHSVATAYSSGVFIYTMPCLDEARSKDLFWRKVCGCSTAPAPSLADGSKSILDKCDGLPLALVSAANYLGGKGVRGSHLTKADCEVLGKELGKFMASDESAFQGIKNTLGQCYNSLPGYNHKMCFLFASLFPKGHPINIKRLARRLRAEGLVVTNGCECLAKLIDMSMIEPASICSNLDAAKRCQLHSIMWEFSIHKSLSRNLVTLIQKDIPLHNIACPVRRLSVQSSTIVEEFELSALTSLTIFDGELSYFNERKLIQVLVLEDCKVLDRKAVDDICELVFLKYLSLRNTSIDKLPIKVRKLTCLETLHIQDTVAAKLPVEVLMLPQLAYLSGKFELLPLAGSTATNKLEEFLKKKSKLHTLAGIVVREAQDGPFEIVILHAKRLKKVKVSCIAAADSSVSSRFPATGDASAPSGTPANASVPAAPDTANVTRTSSSILAPRKAARNKKKIGFFTACIGFPGKSAVQNSASDATPAGASITKSFPADRSTSAQLLLLANSNRQETAGTTLATRLISCLEKRFMGLESLSIDFNGAPNDFLASLKLEFTISSIKVRRGLGRLPGRVELREVRNLTKLQLISTGLSSQQLEALQYLECLEYLKLAEDRQRSWDGDFSVGLGGFASLRWLCFEATKHPRVRIARGAMPCLISLQLLCPESPHTLGVDDDDTVALATAVMESPPGDDGTARATAEIEIESPPAGDDGRVVAAEIESLLGVDGVKHLEHLNEVILHHSVDHAGVEAWKRELKRHKNRPCVKRQPATV